MSGYDSFSGMYEQNMLNEKEVTNLFKLYKKIQVLKWENSLLIIHPDESKNAEWIKKTWELWDGELEGKLTKLCRKMSLEWKILRFVLPLKMTPKK